MTKVRNKKIKLVLPILAAVIVVGLVLGFLWMNRSGSLLKTSAQNGSTQISAANVTLRFLQISPSGTEPLLSTIFSNYGSFTYPQTNGTNYTLTADMITFDQFNANPNGYNLSGYDGLVLGFSDGNRKNGVTQDLNTTALQLVSDFIDTGKPTIFGHDTVEYSAAPNLYSLRGKIGITNTSLTGPIELYTSWGNNFSPNVNAATDAILNTPYKIPVTTSLTSLSTHTARAIYKDDSYWGSGYKDTVKPDPNHASYYGADSNLKHYFCQNDVPDVPATTVSIAGGSYKTIDKYYIKCYAEIYGRFALAQLGNTEAVPTVQEQQLYVNLLFTAYQNSSPTSGGSYTYTDTYNYTNGILINTYADGATVGNAAITKGGTIYYTLEIVNQGTASKTLSNLKFTIPKNYTFDSGVSGNIACENLSPCPTTPASPPGLVTSNGTTQIIWNNVTVPAGTSKVIIKLGT